MAHGRAKVAAVERASESIGRTPVSIVVSDIAADALLYTVTSGKTLYVTDLLLSVSNASQSTGGRGNLRDGLTVAGAVKLPFQIDDSPAAAAASITEQLDHAFITPLSFTVGVFYDTVLGTLACSGLLLGYEE